MHPHSPPAPPLPIASLFRPHAQSFRNHPPLSPQQARVLAEVERCRTLALGGHLYKWEQCSAEAPLYNSCRNRHCPTCQAPAQFPWLEKRKQRLLLTDYFPLVFTLPELLRPRVHRYRRVLFALLFSAAAEPLLTCGRDPKRLGAQLGFSLVLHPWTRELRFPPHLHAIVPGGGLDGEADRWVNARQDFLFPVAALSPVFRGKFLVGLLNLFAAGACKESKLEPTSFRKLTCRLARQDWVVYAQKPFGGPEQSVHYLGLSTPRVAISNSRLLSIQDELIPFRTRGEGTCSVPPPEFIRRFLLHVLPDHFVTIRPYGLLAPAHVNPRLRRAQALRAQQSTATVPSPAPSPVGAASSSARSDETDTSAALARPRCPYCGGRTLLLVGSRPARFSRRPRRRDPPPDTERCNPPVHPPW